MPEIELPYPPASLNPNKRLHWGQRARATKLYRSECRVLSRAQGLRPMKADQCTIGVTFHPPDKRRRDRDNMIAAFKAGADGLADVIQVDDADWVVSYALGEPRKGGCVSVSIMEIGQ